MSRSNIPGSSKTDIFWRIILPATLPSLFTGMTVGMGITWEVVVAAEMIASRSGLGLWPGNPMLPVNYPVIVIGMISIGIAGYISSSFIRPAWRRLTPWLKLYNGQWWIPTETGELDVRGKWRLSQSPNHMGWFFTQACDWRLLFYAWGRKANRFL